MAHPRTLDEASLTTERQMSVFDIYNMVGLQSSPLTLDYFFYVVALVIFCGWWFQWLVHITSIIYGLVDFALDFLIVVTIWILISFIKENQIAQIFRRVIMLIQEYQLLPFVGEVL